MIQPDFSSLLAGGLFLILFGIGYNTVVTHLERRKLSEGYTAILVAVGVIITLGIVAIFDWLGALIALGAFACSGSPMIAGSIYRHMQARAAEQKRVVDDVRQTSRMAE